MNILYPLDEFAMVIYLCSFFIYKIKNMIHVHYLNPIRMF